MREQRFFGVLNINKPSDMTSRKVVDHVVRLVAPAKAGHAGTLDPMATGVLVVCVGAATRLISHVQQQSKVYRAKFLLGRRSDTDDITGNVVEEPMSKEITEREIRELLPLFVGRIKQVPPQFSAVHVDGRRAYKLARRGEAVQIEAKTVEVHRIELLNFDGVELELEIECGSGTYIRSIGRDLGERLGCGAVMSNLVRTRIGPFRLDEAIGIEQLDLESLPRLLQPIARVVEHLARYDCSIEEQEDLRHGRLIHVGDESNFIDDETVAVFMPDGNLACLARFRLDDRTLAPRQVFLEQE